LLTPKLKPVGTDSESIVY